jgi:hypothetical protein
MRFSTTNTSRLSVPRSIVLLVDKALRNRCLKYGDSGLESDYITILRRTIVIDWCVKPFGAEARFQFFDLCVDCIDRMSMREHATASSVFFSFVQITYHPSHLRSKPTHILFVSKQSMELSDNWRTKRVRLVFDDCKWTLHAFNKAS